jgi:hypothetical protein
VSKAAKEWARKARYDFIVNVLGGVCVDCGEQRFKKLEPDHVDGRTYSLEGLSTDQRIGRYRKEHRNGVRFACRCRRCNAKRGIRQRDFTEEFAQADSLPF